MSATTAKLSTAQAIPTADPLLSILPAGAPHELIAAIEDATHRTLHQHGLPAFEMSREASITHETGHAIIGSHEGVTIQSVRIFSRPTPFGTVWRGWCAVDGAAWSSGPDASPENDISAARIIIAGLAGETICDLDKPGSSLDELALSQMLGCTAAEKLAGPGRSDAEYSAYAQQLWHEQVWNVAITILQNNREPFMQLANHLYRKERIQGGKLRKALAQVRRIAP